MYSRLDYGFKPDGRYPSAVSIDGRDCTRLKIDGRDVIHKYNVYAGSYSIQAGLIFQFVPVTVINPALAVYIVNVTVSVEAKYQSGDDVVTDCSVWIPEVNITDFNGTTWTIPSGGYSNGALVMSAQVMCGDPYSSYNYFISVGYSDNYFLPNVIAGGDIKAFAFSGYPNAIYVGNPLGCLITETESISYEKQEY